MEFDQLLDSFINSSDDVRKYIPDKFAKQAELRAIPYIGSVLTNDREIIAVRIECAESLGKLGDDRGINFLSKVINDPNEELRRTVVWSLGQIGTSNTLFYINKLILDKSSLVVRWAIKSLGRIRCDNMRSSFNVLFSNFQDRSDLIKTEIFRAVYSQRNQIILDRWIELAGQYLLSTNNNIILVVLSILSLSDGIKFIEKYELQSILITMLKGSDSRSSYIDILLSILVSLKKSNLIKNIFYNTYDTLLREKIILSLFDDEMFQSKMLKHKNTQLISLQAIGRKSNPICDISSYLAHDNISIRNAALKIHALQGKDYNFLVDIYNEGKGLSGIISLFQYYNEGIDILKYEAIHGNKSCRSVAIKSIIELYKTNPELREFLSLVAKNERVWHIRRDVRIVLE